MVATRGKSDGEEEIKEGTREVVIQVRGCGLLVSLRIKQQAWRVMEKRWSLKEMWAVWHGFVFMGKKGRCFYGNVCMLLHALRTLTWHYIKESMNTHSKVSSGDKKKTKNVSILLIFLVPDPIVSPLLYIYNTFLDISRLNLKCRNNSFTYWMYSPFSVTLILHVSGFLWSNLRCLLI